MTASGNPRPELHVARDRHRVMSDYDALPPALRAWLTGARLQWSPASARRAWRRALWRSLGRERAALARMDALEDAALEREDNKDGVR